MAILDADKEGFLRAQRSLIQTIGRAARHVEGKALLYAENMTDSMAKAIEETERRRKIQHTYNEKHGITPTPAGKKASNSILSFLELSRKLKADGPMQIWSKWLVKRFRLWRKTALDWLSMPCLSSSINLS